jgi:hypothetical protein
MWFIKMLMNPNIIAYLRSSYQAYQKKRKTAAIFTPTASFPDNREIYFTILQSGSFQNPCVQELDVPLLP